MQSKKARQQEKMMDWKIIFTASLQSNWSKNAFVKDKEKDNAVIKMGSGDSRGENVF